MKVIYRISDGGHNKEKPYYVNKRDTFLHFIKIFEGYDIYVVADNISDDTYKFLLNYININRIARTNLGNTGSFLASIQIAMDLFSDDERVYLAEDDYIYTKCAPSIINEGLDIADYSSGYDHPDKYMNHSEGGPNPFIEGGGETTKVILSKSRHWKITNSFCMTFATTVRRIKEDYAIYRKHCSGPHPNDFQMFLELAKVNGRKLVSCIPSVSTHGEIAYLSPFVDWKEASKIMRDTSL
jgi:hypothetical protein